MVRKSMSLSFNLKLWIKTSMWFDRTTQRTTVSEKHRNKTETKQCYLKCGWGTLRLAVIKIRKVKPNDDLAHKLIFLVKWHLSHLSQQIVASCHLPANKPRHENGNISAFNDFVEPTFTTYHLQRLLKTMIMQILSSGRTLLIYRS